MLTKIGTKLNKNNKYRNQIEYRTLTLTRGTLLGWHVDIKIFKKKKSIFFFKKKKKKPRSDVWHATGLTLVYFKKNLKKNLKKKLKN